MSDIDKNLRTISNHAMNFVSVFQMLKDQFPGSYFQERMTALGTLYAEADDAVAAAKRHSTVSCPKGCGTCCEGFSPNILPIEGEFAALYMVFIQPELLSVLDAIRSGESCLFYSREPRHGGHCSIYPARPLICRLFGFSSGTEKFGGSRFIRCRHIAVDGEIDENVFPKMRDFSMLLQTFEGSGRGGGIPISEAVRNGREKVTLMKMMFFGIGGKGSAGETA
jgi:uncharacterized protein